MDFFQTPAMASMIPVLLFISSFIGLSLAAPPGMNFDPNIDPFAPPPGFMPPPPPQQQQNYVNPPPLPPQPPTGGNFWGGAPAQPWSTYNMVNSPAQQSPPLGANDINQPMPPDAATAGSTSSSSYGSGSAPEQEFEQEGGAGGNGGGGGMGGGQMYNPPPAFGVQPRGYYGSQSSSLLDAYYGNGRPQGYGPYYNTNNNNNGFFGGLFGNSPGGNLLGAFMLNEFMF